MSRLRPVTAWRPGPSWCSVRCHRPTRPRQSRPRRFASGRFACVCPWHWTIGRGNASPRPRAFLRREADGIVQPTAVKLDDGRTLWIARRGLGRRNQMAGPGPMPPRDAPGVAAAPPPFLPVLPFGLPPAVGPLLLMGLVFIAVAAGAYPVVRRLTSRLEALKQGVEAFGAGALGHRVDASGRDEVAAVGATFNLAAERIETLVRSHQSLLANASHELRSPLARLKMAASMFADATGAHRDSLKREIETKRGRAGCIGRGSAAGQSAGRRPGAGHR